jgi:hypothetical protein
MKQMIAILTCLLLAAPALAQDKKKEPSEKQKAQQERMKDCNEKAAKKDVKGDDRKKFMSACLKGGPDKAADKPTAQQSKMKDCNKQAGDKNMKGEERKKFMSACLKG